MFVCYYNRQGGITMKNNKKQIWLGIMLLFSVGLTTWSILVEVEAKWLNLLFTLFPILVFYVQNLVENYDKFFIRWNKIKIWFKNPAVEWKKTVTLEMRDEMTQQDLNYIFSKILEDDDFSEIVTEKPQKKHSINNRLQLKFGITEIGIVILPNNNLKIECYSKINYRDSKKEIHQVFNYVLLKFMKYKNTDILLEVYSLKVAFSDVNPFYGLYVSKIEVEANVNFLLKYSIDNIKYVVSNRTIEATTNNREKLDKLSNDFLVLADS